MEICAKRFASYERGITASSFMVTNLEPGNLSSVSMDTISKIIPIPIAGPEDAFMRARLED